MVEYLDDWWMTELELNCAVYRVPPTSTVASTIEQLQANQNVVLVERMAAYQPMSQNDGDPYFEPQSVARALHNEVLTTVPAARFSAISGSSMATAVVSGYVALMLQAQPRLAAHDIRLELLRAENFEDLNPVVHAERTVPGLRIVQ